ncbi:MAG TPA: hypothetical protein VGE29_00345 [Prosthecobacter sp.]
MPSLDKLGFMALWLPFALSLGAAYILNFPVAPADGWLKQLCANFYALTLLWFLFLTIRHFMNGRVVSGLGMIAMVVVLLGIMIPLFIFGQIAEHQAKKSGSPAGNSQGSGGEAARVPQEATGHQALPGGPADLFQTVIRASIQQSTAAQVRLPLGIPSLAKLRTEHPALLDRYLASHPAWRVYEENGHRFAVRRWMNGKRWEMTENGVQFPSEDRQVCCRTSIGFSGTPRNAQAQRIAQGVLADIKSDQGGNSDLWKSEIAVPEADLLVEMLEQTQVAERRMTPTAFAMMEREFVSLLNSTEWAQASRHLTASGIETGKPFIELRQGQQAGSYKTEIRCNPGTAGRVYLKAFDAATEKPLSADALRAATQEWTGWSDDAQQQFLSASYLTIQEGDPGVLYTARFEVWFQPDNGGSERKLLERSFLIQGASL